MNHQIFARISLTAFFAVQGVAQLAIDLNRTHASNPDWIGHARFHVVWQSVSVALLSFLAIGLIWSSGVPQSAGFFLAIGAACISPLGFSAAYIARRVYGGTLSDMSGISPARFRFMGRARSVDMNAAAVLLAYVVLLIIVLIYVR